MIAVLQRVNNATVYADSVFSGSIERGLYILLGIEANDTTEDAELLAKKIANLRIFSDENGKMNLSAISIDAEAMVVSNFTLNANYSHGNRPDFLLSAKPNQAIVLYEYFVKLMKAMLRRVETGKFGADMKTEMSTDGPVTIVMNSALLKKRKDNATV